MKTKFNRGRKIIKYASLLLLAGGFISACSNADREVELTSHNTLTPAEQEEGWILLFNGENTEGWRGYNQPDFPESGWIAEEGTLRYGPDLGRAGGRAGDIIYDQKFGDFVLQLEWKISGNGNSGIFYLGQEIEGQPIWISAPEMQILDNDGHPDAERGTDGNRKAGSLYDLIPANPQNTKPVGEWNHAEIIVQQGTVVHRQNGEDVLVYEMGTTSWNELIAGSKFSEFSQFGQYKPGYIALQDHSDEVWFRNIKVRVL
ncbi:MAG: DUF1080 domain-containing protein [Balneolales bacterium]